MIGHHDNWIRLNFRFTWYSKIAAIVAAFYGGMLNIKADSLPDGNFLKTIIGWTSDSTKYVVPTCGAVVVLVELFKKIHGPPQIWSIMHHLLDEMHEAVFPAACNVAENRVTLFQFKGDRLVPVERSHYLTRKSKAVFRVWDDGKAEGVVGQTYVNQTCIYVENLPNICPDGETGNKNAILSKLRYACYKAFAKRRCLNDLQLAMVQKYAKETWTPEEKIVRQKVLGKSMPRSICALPVEVEGKIWGVIVVDSRNDKLIGKDQIIAFYKQNAGILSKLIKHS